MLLKMSACSKNFQSKFALSNGKTISFDEYARMETKPAVYCIPNKHELIPVFCTKRNPHFRHKHCADMEGDPMTQWHAEWQSNFPITEIPFKNNSKQLRGRRADVVIPQFKRIIEIQHSKIESGEVNDRMADYKVHGHSVEWIVDSQGCILVKKLGDRIVLHFTENWLYESFRGCDSVYYDINEIIYKATPSHVKSCQIEVCEPMLKVDFINNINTSKDLWSTGEMAQSHIYVKQKGAGSGKTYGMMQLLNDDPEISNFKFIIFITKQHSAVNVMVKEFMEQYVDKKLTNIQLDQEPFIDGKFNYTMYKFDRQYIVGYKHKITGVYTYAIFATVDSFTNSVGRANSTAHDTFVSIVQSIKEGVSKVTHSGRLSFARMETMINKETLIMIDETQDLIKLYGEAFLQFVHSTNTNLCVVGDRLQSLQNEENALTFLHNADITMTRIVRESASNEIRRFSDPLLLRFVNKMIKFNEWGLPEMTLHENHGERDDTLTVFSAKTIYANQDSKSDEVVRAVSQIIDFFEREVTINKCIPEDFLFITPFTGQNPLMDALQLAISEFWKNTMQNNTSYIEEVKSKHKYWKDVNPNSYTRYAIFHKAQDVGSINLEESEHATRMVSIHTSKGDGRKVVFVIGVNESSLRTFSQVTNNLIYNSFLHVAITRQKERLYFRLEENGDDVNIRIKNSIEGVSVLSTTFDYPRRANQLSRLADDMYRCHWDSLYENIICKVDTSLEDIIPKEKDNKDNLLIDMGDHNIRYSSMLINIMVHRCNYEFNETLSYGKKSKKTVNFDINFSNIEKYAVKDVYTWKEYIQVLAINTNINSENKKNYKNSIKSETKECPVIPMLYFSKNNTDLDYDRYSIIIRATMDRVRRELTSLSKGGKLDYFCPIESVICYYMLECIRSGKYQKITINDVYNIIHLYSKIFDHSARGHESCQCKMHFSAMLSKMNEYEIKCHKYLLQHYDRMNYLTKLLDDFSKKYPEVVWFYDSYIDYDGQCDDINIYKAYRLIGYDKENVYVFDIKPQLTHINHNETKVSGILDTWLISHVSAKYPNYANKNIISCVISLNISEVYTINWTEHVRANSEYLNKQIYTVIEQTHISKNKSYYNTFMNVIEEKKDVKEVISHLQSSYIDVETKKNRPIPQYIIEFWKVMKNRLEDEDGKAAKLALLTEYKNERYFLTKINRYLHRSLNTFFGIEEDDD